MEIQLEPVVESQPQRLLREVDRQKVVGPGRGKKKSDHRKSFLGTIESHGLKRDLAYRWIAVSSLVLGPSNDWGAPFGAPRDLSDEPNGSLASDTGAENGQSDKETEPDGSPRTHTARQIFNGPVAIRQKLGNFPTLE